MPTELRPPIYFIFGFFLTLVMAATISVYGFLVYERAWGMGGSWQVLVGVAIGSAVIALLAVLNTYKSVRSSGKMLTRARAFTIGIACALTLIGLTAAMPEQTKEYGLWSTALLSAVIPALSILLLSKPANPSLNPDARQKQPRAG